MVDPAACFSPSSPVVSGGRSAKLGCRVHQGNSRCCISPKLGIEIIILLAYSSHYTHFKCSGVASPKLSNVYDTGEWIQ